MNSAEWHRHAACRGLDPELFFPRPGEAAAEARAICATCPVKAECYEAGKDEYYGIWGGTSRKERQIAEKGSLNGRPPTRGCWICGMPVERHTNQRYCSDDCRAKARAASNARWRLNREAAS